ncbi:MAG: GNAT family N-acetyltransferase [Erysipelotrichales bacterium]|nr:GNAT family N-acetyltransferase [Erysipelotrichales bacterium]
MSNVIFRDIEENDLDALKGLIVEALGKGWNFEHYNQSTPLFQALLDVYLSMFLNSSTFGKVAIVDKEIIGVILCSACGEEEKFRYMQKDRATQTLILLSAEEEKRKDIVEHLSVSFQAIGILLEDKINYEGSLEFIAVAKKARGLNIGKSLWNQASDYFKAKKIKQIYLITDSDSSFGFYDNNGFLKVANQEVFYNYSNGKKKNDIFLYEYKF